jgi:arylsulfatase A-like enzyme
MKDLFLYLLMVLVAGAAHAGEIEVASLLDDAAFTGIPDASMPTEENEQYRYDSANQRVQIQTASTTSASNDTSSFTAPINIFSHASVTNDADYHPATTTLDAIIPGFGTTDFAYAGTLELRGQAQVINGWYEITLDTAGGTFKATSGTANLFDGAPADNAALEQLLITAWNSISWDTDPFAGGGITYADINSISIEFFHETLVPNTTDAAAWFNFNSATIGYTAVTMGAPPVPAAENDTYSMWTNSPVNIPSPGVLANDSNATTAALVDDVSHGVLNLQGNGAFSYTPDSDFSGLDTFTYSAGASTALVSLVVREPGVSTRPPNIVLIFADDLGFADVGYHYDYYGEAISADVETPNIDSMASNGVWFSNGYATAPVCGPSRAGLLTGRYQNRFGAEDNTGPYKAFPGDIGTPLTETLLPARLKALGYTTGMMGKWHDGKAIDYYPSRRGFDEVFGFNNGASGYFVGYNDQTTSIKDTNGVVLAVASTNPLYRDELPVEREDDYITDAFGREAVAFIERHHQKPFFLYLSFNAVHGPLQYKQEDYDRFAHVTDDMRRKCLAMNWSMDENIGKVLEALRQYGLEEDTLIIFLSDNGGKPGGNGSYNDPLRGQKGELWEGGIREPFCIQWKGHLPANVRKDYPVISLDVLPTAVAAAGGTLSTNDAIDGVNLLPYLKGEAAGEPHDFIHWRHNKKWVVRDARWKLIDVNYTDGNPPELYDLPNDMSETTDVAAVYPAIAAALQAEHDAWNATLMPKQWGWDSSLPYYDAFFNTSSIPNAVDAPMVSQEWIASNTWQSGTSMDVTADEDSDGFANLYEFARGSDWTMPSSTPQPASFSGSVFPELTFKRRADFSDYYIDFYVESIPDLASTHWNSIGWTQVDVQDAGDGVHEVVTYRYFQPMAQGFFRQRVNSP